MKLYAALGCEVDQGRVEIRPTIEDIDPAREPSADIIVSFDVIEYFKVPHVALSNRAAMLRPDGKMVHRADYCPHDVWRSHHNAATFLTIPDGVWKAMGSNLGYPNRVRHCSFMETLHRLDFRVDERVTRQLVVEGSSQASSKVKGTSE